MFLKLNNNKVVIKGILYAYGRKQQNWLSKEGKTLLTVYTVELMLSCMIDTTEGRDVANSDIPGAFLQTDYNKEDIHIKMEGVMVTLLEDINPAYKKNIYIDSHCRKFMYKEFKKAVYGTLKASLLFWGELSKSLEKWAIRETNIISVWWKKLIMVNSAP